MAIIDLETGFVAQVGQGIEVLVEGVFTAFGLGSFRHERGVAVAVVPSFAGVVDQQVIDAHQLELAHVFV